MIRRVLGIDVASATWSSNGSAIIEFDQAEMTFKGVVPAAISWPDLTLTPQALADAIEECVRRFEVCAVALDGPQGWRSPATEIGAPGVGRRCEYKCRTQGKTGAYPKTYPGNQRPWITFCVELFANLVEREGMELVDSETWKPTEGTCGVLECFPTSAWRSSGLTPLPGKGSKPLLSPYVEALRAAYQLPPFAVQSHDDLQAVVAALTAVGAVRGPAVPRPEGTSSSIVVDPSGSRRVEGLIWNVAPVSPVGQAAGASLDWSEPARSEGAFHSGSVYVTQRVVDQVVLAGETQMQIAFSVDVGGTKDRKRRLSIQVGDEHYTLFAGDTHVCWRSHQDAETLESFELLFAMLADRPGRQTPAMVTVVGAL